MTWTEVTREQVDANLLGLSWLGAEQGENKALVALDLPNERVFFHGDRLLAEKVVDRLLTDAGWAIRDGHLGKISGTRADGSPLRTAECARKDCADPGPFYAVRYLIPPKGAPPGEVPPGRCIQLVPDVACCVAHRDELARDVGGSVRFRRQVVDSLAKAGAKGSPDFSRMRHVFELAGVPRGENQ